MNRVDVEAVLLAVYARMAEAGAAIRLPSEPDGGNVLTAVQALDVNVLARFEGETPVPEVWIVDLGEEYPHERRIGQIWRIPLRIGYVGRESEGGRAASQWSAQRRLKDLAWHLDRTLGGGPGRIDTGPMNRVTSVLRAKARTNLIGGTLDYEPGIEWWAGESA